MTRPQLGQWMIVNREIRKQRHSNVTEWKRTPDLAPFNKPQRGMYVGWRTVRDGRFIQEMGEYDGWYFQPSSYREVWLFVTGERRNPIYALPDDVNDCAHENTKWTDGDWIECLDCGGDVGGPCPSCNGFGFYTIGCSGEYLRDPCDRCYGRGWVKEVGEQSS